MIQKISLIVILVAVSLIIVGGIGYFIFTRESAPIEEENIPQQSATKTAETIQSSDTIRPTISMIAPLKGSLVSGQKVIISANASDSGSGISGVQFLLDDVNLGPEDTSPPYSISWNTSIVPNGTHILSVRARDGAGNTATAISVSVTVSNQTTLLPSGQTRYVDPIFSSVKITKNIVYSLPVVDVVGRTVTPKLDIYEPEGDIVSSRILMLLMHGGGFCNGDKQLSNMVDLAKEYAKRGYVAASIDYRLRSSSCIPFNNDPLAPKAALDAQSDAHAAVRWFYKNAATYKIDTSKIISTGYSAGARLSYRLAYDYEMVGGPNDTNVSNPGYPSRTSIAVVIGLSGTININILQSWDTEPLIFFYGELDAYYPQVGIPVKKRADSFGIINELYLYPGADHYTNLFTHANVVDMINKSGLFIYKNILN